MSSLKKRAREGGCGRFTSAVPVETQEVKKSKRGRPRKERLEVNPSALADECVKKRPPRRPRIQREKKPEILSTFEVSITVSVGGVDIDCSLMRNAQVFLQEKTLAGKCSLERGGAAFHLHLQMVVRMQAKSLISISKTLKECLGWGKSQPIGGMVLCKKLANKGLHTFHGMLGYCMKDSMKDHYQTIDHNVTAEDLNLGLEQYALRGQEENKNRIVLTSKNLVERVYMWRKFNCKHPLIIDFSRDIYEMLKTGRYYPAASWVVGGCGKGYDPWRMQSLYKMMVRPMEITREDVRNVFESTSDFIPAGTSRKDWFRERWMDKDSPVQEAVHEPPNKTRRKLFDDKSMGDCMKPANTTEIGAQEVEKTATFNEQDFSERMDLLCRAALETPSSLAVDKGKKKKKIASPTRRLWPEEWDMGPCYSSSSYIRESSSSEYKPALHPLTYIPLYTRTDPALLIS